MSTPLDLDKLMELAEKATPGRWHADGPYTGSVFAEGQSSWVLGDGRQADAEYVAACSPDAIRELVGRCKRYEEALTPSGDTKAAYHGEFLMDSSTIDNAGRYTEAEARSITSTALTMHDGGPEQVMVPAPEALSTARREHAEVVAAKVRAEERAEDLETDKRQLDEYSLKVTGELIEIRSDRDLLRERLAKLRANWQPVSEKLSGGGDIEEYDEPIDYLNQILADRDLLRARVEELEKRQALVAYLYQQLDLIRLCHPSLTADDMRAIAARSCEEFAKQLLALPPDPATSGGEKPKVGDRCVECVGHTKPDGYFCGYCGCWCRPDGTSDSHAPDQTTESPQPERGGGA
jgi:hypothetical protein